MATCAAMVALPAGIALGYALVRVPFRGKWLVEALINLPLVLPPVVTGYLLLVLFGARGPIGSLLLRLVRPPASSFTWLGGGAGRAWWSASR